MKPLYICIFLALSAFIYVLATYAQQYVVTEDGRRVILHRDGSWEYLHSHEHHPETKAESGRKARILLEKDTMIYLDNGQLADFSIQSNGPRLYDNMTGKLKKLAVMKLNTTFIPTG